MSVTSESQPVGDYLSLGMCSVLRLPGKVPFNKHSLWLTSILNPGAGLESSVSQWVGWGEGGETLTCLATERKRLIHAGPKDRFGFSFFLLFNFLIQNDFN